MIYHRVHHSSSGTAAGPKKELPWTARGFTVQAKPVAPAEHEQAIARRLPSPTDEGRADSSRLRYLMPDYGMASAATAMSPRETGFSQLRDLRIQAKPTPEHLPEFVRDQGISGLQPPQIQPQPTLDAVPLVNRASLSSAAIAGGNEAPVDEEVEQTIERSRSSGQPLANSVRRSMEQAFGTDFQGVKIHADSTAERLSGSLNARAFTTGRDIFFNKGQYNPHSQSGQTLLAHELTHVVQQTGNRNSTPIRRSLIQRDPLPPDNALSAPVVSSGEDDWESIITQQLESFLQRFSHITIIVRWVEDTGTQCRERMEPVTVHPPYFINKDAEGVDRKQTALENRQNARTEVKSLLNEIRRPTTHRRGGMGRRRALVGKSTPEDIQVILQQAVDRGLVEPQEGSSHPTSEDLRNWLVRYGIGIDCSGFVAQALNQVMEQVRSAPLSSAETLDPSNTGSISLRGGNRRFSTVSRPQDLRPGDTMHKPGHIRIVTRVTTNSQGHIEFTTAESSSVDDVGPTRNVWRYENPEVFENLQRWNGSDWVPGDVGKQVTFGRYRILEEATQLATPEETPLPAAAAAG